MDLTVRTMNLATFAKLVNLLFALVVLSKQSKKKYLLIIKSNDMYPFIVVY